MRRMKIRAKPNFGGGGPVRGSAPRGPAGASSSSSSSSSSGPNTAPSSEDHTKATLEVIGSAVHGDKPANSSQTKDLEKPSAGQVEVTSGTEEGGSEDKAKEFKVEYSSSSMHPQSDISPKLSLSPDLTKRKSESCPEPEQKFSINKVESTDNTALQSADGDSDKLPSEINAFLVPSPQSLNVPQVCSDTTGPATLSESTSKATSATPAEVVSTVVSSSTVTASALPSVDTPNHGGAGKTQQDMEEKPAASTRRKKTRFMPMVGASRKGNTTEKLKENPLAGNNNKQEVKVECSEEIPGKKQTSASEESIVYNSETESSSLNIHECTKRGEANTLEKLDVQQLEQVHCAEKETIAVSASPQCTHACSPGREASQEGKNNEQETTASKTKCDEVVFMEDSVDASPVVQQSVEPDEKSQTSTASCEPSTATPGYKRRPKIRAKPTFLTKKRKDDNQDIKKQINLEPFEPQPTLRENEAQVKNATDNEESIGLDNERIIANADCKEDVKIDPCKLRTDFSSVPIEMSVVDNETEKNNQSIDVTEKKKPKDPVQTQRISKEIVHTTSKDGAERTESTLSVNYKSCRKKKLSENKEIEPDVEVVDLVKSSVQKVEKKVLTHGDSEGVISSDDSSGDKENASVAIKGSHITKKERTAKENAGLATQKGKVKPVSPGHTPKKSFDKIGRKMKLEDKAAAGDDRTEKQIFRKRKNEFRKKLSKGDLEPGKMTMFDLIYWNPASNPMPGRTGSPKSKARASGGGDAASIASEAAEEQEVEDLGLDTSDPLRISSPSSPKAEVKANEEGPEEEKDSELATNEEEPSAAKDIFAPRVKIGPNGEIMIDEQSIKIQTTAAKNRDEVLSKAVVVEESNDSSHYGKWSKRRRRSCEWTVKETALFYKALSTVGTDFSLMETLIKWRSRAELKTKFKKEERSNRELVDMALKDSTQFDMSVFEDESDYDPEEDRKASRLAERMEAKRRRLEMRQQDKMQEMEKKKLQNKKQKSLVRNRKKLLRKAYKNRGKKRKDHDSSDNYETPTLDDSDTNCSEYSAAEQEPVIKIKPRVSLKRRQVKRRDSLVISEVTVTMETVKYDQVQPSDSVAEQTINEDIGLTSVSQPSQCSSLVGVRKADESDPDDVHEEKPHQSTSQTQPNQSEEYILGDVLNGEAPSGEEVILPSHYTDFPLTEVLPDSYIIEGMLDSADPNTDITQLNNLEPENVSEKESDKESAETGEGAAQGPQNTVVSVTGTSSENDDQRMWHFPVSAIQTLDDGQQVIVVPTSTGQYNVPVPVLPPGTSNVVVVATAVPESPGEHIYHVYVVSPLEPEGV